MIAMRLFSRRLLSRAPSPTRLRGSAARNRSSRIPRDRLHFAAIFPDFVSKASSRHGGNPSRHIHCRPKLVGWTLLGLVLCASQSGCVQRRMMVRTNPPGALLYVDDYPIGTTPCSTNFTYYGTRKIQLVKDGYETLTVMQTIPAPWYEYTPLDFVAENFVPGQIHDQRTLDYQLRPQVVVPTEQLLRGPKNFVEGFTRPPAPRRNCRPAAFAARPSSVPRPYRPPAPSRFRRPRASAASPSIRFPKRHLEVML